MIQSQSATDPNHQVHIEVENSNNEDTVYQTVDGQPINQPVVTEQSYSQSYHQTYQSHVAENNAEKASTDSYLEKEHQPGNTPSPPSDVKNAENVKTESENWTKKTINKPYVHTTEQHITCLVRKTLAKTLTIHFTFWREKIVCFELPYVYKTMCEIKIGCQYKNEEVNCSVLLILYGEKRQKVYKVDDGADGDGKSMG